MKPKRCDQCIFFARGLSAWAGSCNINLPPMLEAIFDDRHREPFTRADSRCDMGVEKPEEEENHGGS